MNSSINDNASAPKLGPHSTPDAWRMAVFAAIVAGHTTAAEIERRIDPAKGNYAAFRCVDRALQYLRREKLIRFEGRWRLTPEGSRREGYRREGYRRGSR